MIYNMSMTNIYELPNMKALTSSDGKEYLLYVEIAPTVTYSFPSGVGHDYTKVYLFMPQHDVTDTCEVVTKCDYLVWDGGFFEFYEKALGIDIHSLDVADKLKWMATDLMHLYMEMANYGLNIDTNVLEEFLKNTGHIKEK